MQGRRTPATVVDHIVPHKGDKKLFWDSGNWQPLCGPCHSRKTAKEDGGFSYSVLHAPDVLVRIEGCILSLAAWTLDIMLFDSVVVLPDL